MHYAKVLGLVLNNGTFAKSTGSLHKPSCSHVFTDFDKVIISLTVAKNDLRRIVFDRTETLYNTFSTLINFGFSCEQCTVNRQEAVSVWWMLFVHLVESDIEYYIY